MAARGEVVRAGLIGVLLLVIGLGAWGTSRVFAGIEAASYAPNAIARDSVELTAGRSYELSYPGGVRALVGQGLNPAELQCDWQRTVGRPHELSVQTAPLDTALVNVVGTFLAPAGGEVMISCGSLGTLFVDDADDARPDVAGWFLVLATAALVAGAALCLVQLHAGRRMRSEGRRGLQRAAGEDEEVEGLVRVVHLRALDDEVVEPDGRDVVP